jgi:hypothetical protein
MVSPPRGRYRMQPHWVMEVLVKRGRPAQKSSRPSHEGDYLQTIEFLHERVVEDEFIAITVKIEQIRAYISEKTLTYLVKQKQIHSHKIRTLGDDALLATYFTFSGKRFCQAMKNHLFYMTVCRNRNSLP